ncbi:MAG TPA: type II toxin-antitoxin system HicB family antitoxin [Chloroflexota bacterium]|nr:type II toxin-antitoxin system HicB family antitoxin [Chloroflexota bacterium]
MQIPQGFFKAGDTVPVDPDATAMDVGYIDGYRVIYTEYKSTWHAKSPDLPGIFAGGDTRDDAEHTMREAIAFDRETSEPDAALARS